MKRTFIATMALSIALCSSAFAEVADRIVAVVDGGIITQTELDSALNSADGFADSRLKVRTKEAVLDLLVEQKLIRRAAERAGIDVSEQEIDNAIEDVLATNSMTKDALMRVLDQSGVSYRAYREQLKDQIREFKFVNREVRSGITIQDDDVEEYYRKNIKDFTAESEYRFKMIFLSNEGRTASKKLDAVMGGLRSGEGFEALAREYSDGPNPSGGGDVGYLKDTEMESAIYTAVKGLTPGQISDPLIFDEGIYLIKLEDSRPSAPKALEDVKKAIQEKLFKKAMDERLRSLVAQMKKSAHIEIRQ